MRLRGDILARDYPPVVFFRKRKLRVMKSEKDRAMAALPLP
jgi:hypothetical protein